MQVEVMGYREHVCVSWRFEVCVCVCALWLEWRKGGGGRLALAALHHIHFFIHAS